jgi:[acyl-carrier-protein] S-malonyltransferase
MSKLAIVFPGQGSQAVGMLADIAPVYPIVEQTFAEASNVLGYDMWQLVQQGPAEKLNTTTYTQPAILTASIAVWRIINPNNKLKPASLAGHSLGEYSALVASGVLDFTAAVKIVAARGQFMQEAVSVGVGAMAAIVGLNAAMVAQICEEAAQQDVVSPVNLNAPEQIVIAGHVNAVERACALAKAQGAKLAILLPVSVPAHCVLMLPAAERLAEMLNTITFNKPQIPVINNVDVATLTDSAAIKDALVRQLHSPVRWVETIEAMNTDKIDTLIECGPGKVLAGLVKRIAPQISCQTTHDLKSLQGVIDGRA